jgi:hypothetical protein
MTISTRSLPYFYPCRPAEAWPHGSIGHDTQFHLQTVGPSRLTSPDNFASWLAYICHDMHTMMQRQGPTESVKTRSTHVGFDFLTAVVMKKTIFWDIMPYHHHNHWQNSPFWAIAFRTRFCQIASGFHFFGFPKNIFLQSKVVSLASNPQPGAPGLCIYVPQWQGGPVITPGTGFPFRGLLSLTGLRLRYSNPPPHGI